VRTYDNLEVPQTHHLRWFHCCFGGFNLGNSLFALDRECNYLDGMPKPYWILHIVGFRFTGGWLFDECKETK